MTQQTLFPFSFEMAEEKLTSRSGLSLFAEFYKAIGLSKLTDKYLPRPLSNRGFLPSVYVNALCLLLTAGGSCLDDIRELEEERDLFDVLGIKTVPDPTSIGDWLRRTGEKGLSGLALLMNDINKKIMEKDDITEYTLDIDATEIIAEKRDALYTYKNNKGYMPMLGFIFENNLCINDDFREGNTSPRQDNLEFYLECKKSLPEGKVFKYFRADSASYQSKLINKLNEDGVKYAITAILDSSVKRAVESITGWIKPEGKDYEIGEVVHSTDKADHAFRLVVKREYRKQPDMFEEGCFYHAVATNIPEEEMNTLSVLEFHNKRGQAENFNKEVKLGFGLEQMPCGEFLANAVFFRIGIIAYNLFVGFKKLFTPDMFSQTISTFRWKLINIAGRITRHAGGIMLKISAAIEKLNRFLDIRQKIISCA